MAYIAPDEYDCLIAPLLGRLIRGEGRSDISEFLWFELEDHFGLDPAARDFDGMANRLVAGCRQSAPSWSGETPGDPD